MIWLQRSTHSLQMKTPGPATRRTTLSWLLPQNEHLNASAAAVRDTRLLLMTTSQDKPDCIVRVSLTSGEVKPTRPPTRTTEPPDTTLSSFRAAHDNANIRCDQRVSHAYLFGHGTLSRRAVIRTSESRHRAFITGRGRLRVGATVVGHGRTVCS